MQRSIVRPVRTPKAKINRVLTQTGKERHTKKDLLDHIYCLSFSVHVYALNLAKTLGKPRQGAVAKQPNLEAVGAARGHARGVPSAPQRRSTRRDGRRRAIVRTIRLRAQSPTVPEGTF
ncbi:hypothetical protein J6590_029944 [Homalodisca vitripennis]|nr:hypothetical protein J6590_029944 [Homalodisca vitripennis]